MKDPKKGYSDRFLANLTSDEDVIDNNNNDHDEVGDSNDSRNNTKKKDGYCVWDFRTPIPSYVIVRG